MGRGEQTCQGQPAGPFAAARAPAPGQEHAAGSAARRARADAAAALFLNIIKFIAHPPGGPKADWKEPIERNKCDNKNTSRLVGGQPIAMHWYYWILICNPCTLYNICHDK